jgi:hypothetical protein
MPRVTAAAPAARTRARRNKAGKVVTDGVVCYHDAGVLLIVPTDTTEADVQPVEHVTRMRMATQQTTTWEVLQNHPISKGLEADVQLALLCEYIDLRDELEGMSLSDYIDGYFATAEGDAPEAEAEAPAAAAAADEDEAAAAEPSANGDGTKADPRPASMVGLRAVYRFPGRNVLTNAAGITRDANGVVEFTDVDGEDWTNITRTKVFPIKPADYIEIHVMPREAKEITGWLEAGKPAKGHAEGELLRSLFHEFTGHPDRIAFAVMNGKRPFVDRFVSLPNNGFEDDQKPITRLLGEHCFRVRGKDYIVNVVTP